MMAVEPLRHTAAPNPGVARIQRKCACGATARNGAQCRGCAEKDIQRKLVAGASNDPLEHEADRVAGQVVSAGSRTSPLTISIRPVEAGDARSDEAVPASVEHVLAGHGRPLDRGIRGEMERHFNHDFSDVRVHDNAQAARSAEEVDAQAYTVGNSIVFGMGRFAPDTAGGRRLVAHELAHVVQQSGTRGPLRRTPKDKNPLDEKAKKIIEAAKDKSKTIEQRSIETVWAIIRAYYDDSKVSEVIYVEKGKLKGLEKFEGLSTEPVGKAKDIKGKITVVGDYFVNNIDSFARRVLQVGHELQHVEQQQGGMGGNTKKAEREFLAYHWEATQSEQQGTGRMQHSMKVSLIDGALGNFYCIPEDVRKSHTDKKDELLRLREVEINKGGQDKTAPPTECKPSS